MINLGNLFFQTGRYEDALSQYSIALAGFIKTDIASSRTYLKLLLKMSVVYYQLEQYHKAREYYLTAQEISPDETAQYAYLKNKEQKDTRSLEHPGYSLVLQYIEEE
jgi:tetratricopeptide (TPR) repeat protein